MGEGVNITGVPNLITLVPFREETDRVRRNLVGARKMAERELIGRFWRSTTQVAAAITGVPKYSTDVLSPGRSRNRWHLYSVAGVKMSRREWESFS
jgi:hypothetical protein